MNPEINITGPDNDSSPEAINEYFEVVKKGLSELGVDNLTTAEGVRLRRYLEGMLNENKALEANPGAYEFNAIGLPAEESIARFLLDYGINIRTLPTEKGKSFWTDAPVMEYIRRELRKAREKQHHPYLD